MLTQIPESVQQAWGEVAARDFTFWLEEVMSEETIPRSEWGAFVKRFDAFEQESREFRREFEQNQQQSRRELAERLEQSRRESDERLEQSRRESDERLDRQNSELNRRIEAAIALFEQRFDRQAERLDQVQARIIEQTRWTVGTLAFFCSLVAAMLAITQFAR